jgi:hypothetical protein
MSDARSRSLSAWRGFAILAASALAGVALSSAIGILPTYRVAGLPGVGAMAAAAGMVALVSAAATLPVALARPTDAKGVLRAVQLSMLARFVLTLALALAVVVGTSVPRAAFLIWVAIHYLVALVGTTVAELWWLKVRRAETAA